MTLRVLFAGGGTAGHVVPSLATASALRTLRADSEVEFVGTARGHESRMVPAAGWTLHHVRATPLRGRGALRGLAVPLVVWQASSDVSRLIERQGIGAACAFGGYVSGPLALAARRRRIPLVVHEQNAVPGLANRLAARWAVAVAASVPGTERAFPHPERVTVTGNPVRSELLTPVPGAPTSAREALGLAPERFTLLAFGGSLGSRSINDALLGTARRWRNPAAVQILHVTGERDHADVRARWEAEDHALRVLCVPFVERMDLAYAAADVVLCRAGASTVAELTAVGLPSILVPYPHAAADEQTANARALAGAGAATVVADADLTPDVVVRLVEDLFAEPARRAAAAEAARALGRPDAAEEVARLVLAAAEGARS